VTYLAAKNHDRVVKVVVLHGVRGPVEQHQCGTRPATKQRLAQGTEEPSSNNVRLHPFTKQQNSDMKRNELRGPSPRANYTDRAIGASRRSYCQLFADRGCHVVSVTDPYGRILDFLDRSLYFFFQ
jgi:hypothetical protein